MCDIINYYLLLDFANPKALLHVFFLYLGHARAHDKIFAIWALAMPGPV